MRTFRREDFLAAREAWETGDYGWQWQTIRRAAAERGFIYPPVGTKHDDRESQEPSQRAIVWRALQDNPSRTEAIVWRSRSWSDVVDGIFGLESRLREEAGEEDRNRRWDRRDDPTHIESAQSIASILSRMRDSVA